MASITRETKTKFWRPGKPHPRWAEQTYYDGDASDKWHTRSQRRGSLLSRPRRLLTPPAEQHGAMVKTEPMGELQQPSCYYRLSPSPPPPSATSTTYSMSMNHLGSNHYGSHGYPLQVTTNGNGIGGNSPVAYSPSSNSGSSGGLHGGLPCPITRYMNGETDAQFFCSCQSL